ncbi:hypothetical protein HK101_002306, partial [Irineochytrium annulatum]
ASFEVIVGGSAAAMTQPHRHIPLDELRDAVSLEVQGTRFTRYPLNRRLMVSQQPRDDVGRGKLMATPTPEPRKRVASAAAAQQRPASAPPLTTARRKGGGAGCDGGGGEGSSVDQMIRVALARAAKERRDRRSGGFATPAAEDRQRLVFRALTSSVWAAGNHGSA